MEEGEIVCLREVDLAFAPLDVLEPDPVFEVDATDGCRGDLHLTEPSVEQLSALGQRKMGAFLQGLSGDKVTDVARRELRARDLLL